MDEEYEMNKGLLITIVAILVIMIYFTAGFLLLWGWLGEQFSSMAFLDVMMLIGVFLVFVVGIWCYWRREDDSFLVKLLVGVLVLGLAGGIVHGAVVVPCSGDALYGMVKFVDEPVNVVMTRIIPLKTAYAYAISRLQIPTHTIYMEESYIYYDGDIPVYNWIVEPEGLFNEWGRDARGVVLVYGEYPPRVEFVEKRLAWSLHRARFGILYWNLMYGLKANRMTEQPIMDDNIEVVVDGKVYVLIPYKAWIRGAMHYYPVLGGYALLDEEGNLEYVPADKLMEHPVTKKIFSEYRIPVLPEVIAREWIDLLRWHPGFWEVMLFHQTFEIRDIGTNPQPYLVFDENGHLWWLFTVEPSGESYAIKYLIYVDAESPTPNILVYKPKVSWIGASKVENYVKKAHPMYDWEEFSIEEPIPLVINNTLYWKVSIITKDGRGLVSIDLVNAETGEVHSLQVKRRVTIQDFYSFIETEILGKHATGVSENVILGNATTIQEKIQAIKQKIHMIQQELEVLIRELEELEKQLNQTES